MGLESNIRAGRTLLCARPAQSSGRSPGRSASQPIGGRREDSGRIAPTLAETTPTRPSASTAARSGRRGIGEQEGVLVVCQGSRRRTLTAGSGRRMRPEGTLEQPAFRRTYLPRPARSTRSRRSRRARRQAVQRARKVRRQLGFERCESALHARYEVLDGVAHERTRQARCFARLREVLRLDLIDAIVMAIATDRASFICLRSICRALRSGWVSARCRAA